MKQRLWYSILLVAFTVSSGCYSYRLRPLDDVGVGTIVRARVSAEQAGEISDALGAEMTRSFDATFLEWSGAEQALFEVQVPGTALNMMQRISIPRADVLEVEVREFDRWKTLAVAVPALGIASALIASQFGGDANKKGEVGEGVDQQRITIFSISR